MNTFNVGLFIVGSFALGVLCTMVSVLLGGALVLRARTSGYEPLLPPLKAKQDEVAVNLSGVMDDADDGAPDIEKILEERSKEFEKATESMLHQMRGE